MKTHENKIKSIGRTIFKNNFCYVTNLLIFVLHFHKYISTKIGILSLGSWLIGLKYLIGKISNELHHSISQISHLS